MIRDHTLGQEHVRYHEDGEGDAGVLVMIDAFSLTKILVPLSTIRFLQFGQVVLESITPKGII